jgi:hypothetical protein
MSTYIRQGDYLTNGRRLVQVQMLLPDGEALVEDAQTYREEHMSARELSTWMPPRDWALAHRHRKAA